MLDRLWNLHVECPGSRTRMLVTKCTFFLMLHTKSTFHDTTMRSGVAEASSHWSSHGLIEGGADGNAPIRYALLYGPSEVAMTLIDKGGDLNARYTQEMKDLFNTIGAALLC